jgi:hypothetical protein
MMAATDKNEQFAEDMEVQAFLAEAESLISGGNQGIR